jgi:NodT family efflux transporter outer membrane factor (OMF) lipoprotein
MRPRVVAAAALIAVFFSGPRSADAQPDISSYEPIWSTLGGPVLQRLLRAGLAGAPALAEAEALVRAADAAAQEAGADRLPSASVRVSRTNTRSADIALADASAQRMSSSSWESGVELQHTFDLWGRAAATARAAGAEADAARLDQEGARALLARDVVQAFADLAFADSRADTVARSIDDARETLRLTRVRSDNGVASALDVEAAAAELERLLIARADVERSRAVGRARLSALVGEQPLLVPPLNERLADVLERDVSVPPFANVRDLHSRPDLQAIELRAQAAGLRVNAARAALYPDLTLSSGLSTGARGVADAFDPRFLAANLVVGLGGPIFDGGRRRARLEAAHADADRIAAEQHSALLRAMQEVIEAQSSLTAVIEQRAGAARRVAAQGRVVHLLEAKRAAGSASLLDVLRERAALIGATEDVARLAAEQLSAVARLLVATGSSPSQRIIE